MDTLTRRVEPIEPATPGLLRIYACGPTVYSRVHVGVHYPGDVLAGLAIGSGIALAGRRVGRRPLSTIEPVDLWAAPAGDGAASPGAPAA